MSNRRSLIFDFGPASVRPAAATFGPGVYYSKDTGAIDLSDGVSWVNLQPANFTFSAARRAFTSGLYYSAAEVMQTGDTTLPMVVGTAYWIPFPVDNPGAGFDQISLEQTAAGTAGALIDLAIFADDGFGKPGSLISGGDLSPTGIAGDGANGVKTVAISPVWVPTPGMYWLQALCTVAAVTVRARTLLRPVAALNSGGNANVYSWVQASLAGPGATSPATPVASTTATVVPKIMLRAH